MASIGNNWLTTLPVFGGMFENEDVTAVKEQYDRMAKAYEQYRQQNAQARQAQLGTQFDLFGPQQQALSAMMPGIKPFNLEGAAQQFQTTTNGISAGQGPGGAVPAPAYYTPTGKR